MLIVTIPSVPGYRFEAVVGMVSSGPQHNILTAMTQLWQKAQEHGGNAVVGARFGVETRGDYSGMFFAYGTVVIVQPIPEGQPGATPQSAAQVMQ